MVRKLLGTTIVIAMLTIMVQVRPGFAATICVNPAGSGGCLATIGAAVAAASPGDTIVVAVGTYNEQVTLTETLSLVGAGAGKSIIDANGQPTGITIGTTSAPTSGVTVAGFTVENADFEGILIQNATGVAVLNNLVQHNNRSLTAGECPGLPSQETLEGFDCGEGIHLLGVDHSTISGNTSVNNAGGILLSDDAVGPTHDNLISGNRVYNNAADCGITLASHPTCAPPATCSTAPYGVYHNTISNNVSNHNGTAAEGGAGVGIFDSVPGTSNYGNVIVGNILTNNGLPGVAMHSHAPDQNLDDNQITGNTIYGNGADNGDTTTPGKTGINVFTSGGSPVTGTVISGNSISNEKVGVFVSDISGTDVEAHNNNLFGGSTTTGIDNGGAGSVNGTANWWGCPTGPGASGCSKVAGTVAVSPVLPQPVQ